MQWIASYLAVVKGRRGGLWYRKTVNIHTYLTMAEQWFAVEVVRELEEAGARYFALLLLSPSSLTTLVSAGYAAPRGRARRMFVLFPTLCSQT